MTVEVAAIVLAAGHSARFGGEGGENKVYAELDDRALVAHAVAAAKASRASPVIVVTGHAAHLAAGAFAHAQPDEIVHNPDYGDGMASSLRAGLRAVPPRCGGALVLLADMPLVAASTLDALISCFDPGEADAAVPYHGGRRGNPALLGRSLFAEAMALSGDQGARPLLERKGTRVSQCDVGDDGILADIDTPEALAELRNGRRPS